MYSQKVTAGKAEIFSKRTADAITEPTTADTAIDGLHLSLAMRGRVDMQYISGLTGKNESELERELADMIYRNPKTNLHELAEEYLSGNVREKIAQVQATVNRITLTKLQLLMKLYCDFANIKMPEDLPHLTRPKLKNDSRMLVQIEPSRAFKNLRDEVKQRSDTIRDEAVKPDENNMLKITSELRKASLDMQVTAPSIPELEAGANPDGICNTVTAKYYEIANVNGAQLIFRTLARCKQKTNAVNVMRQKRNRFTRRSNAG